MDLLPEEVQAFGMAYVCKHAVALHAPRVGDRPRWVPASAAHNIDAAFYVCRSAPRWPQPAVVVLLRDDSVAKGGASLTHVAESVVETLFTRILRQFKLDWEQLRWLYRDTQGTWDEIVADCGPRAHRVTVDFRSLGAAKTLPDALTYVSTAAAKVMS